MKSYCKMSFNFTILTLRTTENKCCTSVVQPLCQGIVVLYHEFPPCEIQVCKKLINSTFPPILPKI